MAFDQREELKLRSSSVDRPSELVQFPVLGSDRTREIYSAHVPNQLETLHWGKGVRERERTGAMRNLHLKWEGRRAVKRRW